MKFLDNLTLESFKNPVLYSVIGSYVLNNFTLIVGFIFNVYSNPIGESEVFVKELKFSYFYFFILFAAQTLGKPTMALLISLIKSFYVRLEKEILQWGFFFTYKERYHLLKERIYKHHEIILSNDSLLNKTLNSFINYFDRMNNIKHYFIKYHGELPIDEFLFINEATNEIETTSDSITYSSYCLGYCTERIGDYYLLITESDFIPDNYKERVNQFINNNPSRTQLYLSIKESSPYKCKENDKFRCISVDVKMGDQPSFIRLEIPKESIKRFYFSGVFDYDKSIKEWSIRQAFLEDKDSNLNFP